MGKPVPFWKNFSNSKVSAVAKRIIEILDEDQQVNVLLACNTAANQMGLKFHLDDHWIQLASFAHNFIRQKDRLQIVKTIAQMGLPFTLIGKNWEHNVDLGLNVKFIDDLDNNEITKYYSDSKIVINLNSSNGACERLFDSMSAGACVVSDYDEALLSIFKDGKDLCLFDRRKPISICKSIEYLLKEEKTFNMSIRASNLVRENHLWHHRAQTVGKIFDSLK